MEQITQLYLNKLLSTSSERTLRLHVLLHISQNTDHFVHLPYGTGNKKYYTKDIHKIYTNITNKLLQEMYFMLESVSQFTRPSVCLPFKNLNHDFQFSKLSVKTDLENELMVAKGKDRMFGCSCTHCYI